MLVAHAGFLVSACASIVHEAKTMSGCPKRQRRPPSIASGQHSKDPHNLLRAMRGLLAAPSMQTAQKLPRRLPILLTRAPYATNATTMLITISRCWLPPMLLACVKLLRPRISSSYSVSTSPASSISPLKAFNPSGFAAAKISGWQQEPELQPDSLSCLTFLLKKFVREKPKLLTLYCWIECYLSIWNIGSFRKERNRGNHPAEYPWAC